MDKIEVLKELFEDNHCKNSPFRYGIAKSSAKRILNFFSIVIFNKLEIIRHYNQNKVFLKTKADYVIENNFKNLHTYSLTVEIHGKNKTNVTNEFFKEYFYLKLIFNILFKDSHLTTKELINLIKK